jgi:hypothetical protein
MVRPIVTVIQDRSCLSGEITLAHESGAFEIPSNENGHAASHKSATATGRCLDLM